MDTSLIIFLLLFLFIIYFCFFKNTTKIKGGEEISEKNETIADLDELLNYINKPEFKSYSNFFISPEQNVKTRAEANKFCEKYKTKLLSFKKMTQSFPADSWYSDGYGYPAKVGATSLSLANNAKNGYVVCDKALAIKNIKKAKDTLSKNEINRREIERNKKIAVLDKLLKYVNTEYEGRPNPNFFTSPAGNVKTRAEAERYCEKYKTKLLSFKKMTQLFKAEAWYSDGYGYLATDDATSLSLTNITKNGYVICDKALAIKNITQAKDEILKERREDEDLVETILFLLQNAITDTKLTLNDINIIEAGLKSKFLYKTTQKNRYQEDGLFRNSVNILENLTTYEILESKNISPGFDSSEIEKNLTSKLELINYLDMYLKLLEKKAF